jgi:hypothetical protein
MYEVKYLDQENGKVFCTRRLVCRHWQIESEVHQYWPNEHCQWATWDVIEENVKPPPVYMVLEIAGIRHPQYDPVVRSFGQDGVVYN